MTQSARRCIFLLLGILALIGCARHPAYGVPKQPPLWRTDTATSEPDIPPPPK